MSHADFIVWMLLFPISIRLEDWVGFKSERIKPDAPEHVQFIVSSLLFSMWVGIGYKLY